MRGLVIGGLAMVWGLGVVLPAQQVVHVRKGVHDAVNMVSVKVNPSIVFAGASVIVTCQVQPSKDNRVLWVGVNATRESSKDVDEQSRRVHTLRVDHVPCVASVAYCVLGKADKSTTATQVPLRVLGCEEGQ